jgi:hypothetical protein
MLFQFGDQRICVIPHYLVDVDKFFVDISYVGIFRFEREKKRAAADEWLDEAIVFSGPAAQQLNNQLPLAACPFYEWFAHLLISLDFPYDEYLLPA